MTQKISDFLPTVAQSANMSLYQNSLPWFDEFLKSTKQTVHAPEVGIEMLYFDWLRTAYAYRRMLIQDLCLVAFDIAEVRACIMVRRNEVFRKGFNEWEPRFVVKCVNCGKEFQTIAEHCDECFATEVQFQGYEDEMKTAEDGSQEVIKNPIYKTVYSRDENGGKIPSKVRSPDLSQVHRFESFKKIANDAGQSLEDVLRQAMEFCYITDDGYILRSKEYYFENNRLSGSKISEVRALHPALVEFDLDKNGLFKKSHWICLEHRDTVRDAEGPCLECGKQTYPVMYVYNHRGKKVYLTEEEVIHYSVASPSVVYGYSLILSILQKALTLSGMDRCFAADTDILTKTGWKSASIVGYDDEIATVSKNNIIEYQKPTYVHSYFHDGKMYELKTNNIDLLTTPRHRMFVRFVKENAYSFREAQDIEGKQAYYLRGGLTWIGKEEEYFTLPSCDKNKKGTANNLKNTVVNSSEWMRFLGYWYASGWVTNKNIVLSVVNKMERNIVKRNVDELPISWNINGRYIGGGNVVISNYLKQFNKDKTTLLATIEKEPEYAKHQFYNAAAAILDTFFAKTHVIRYNTLKDKLYFFRDSLNGCKSGDDYSITIPIPTSKVHEEKIIAMDLWLEFLGYWLSEGSVTGINVQIAQKPGQKKEIIRECLYKLPFKWREIGGGFICSSKQLSVYLKQFGKAKDKFIPENIRQLSTRQLLILFNALMLGDGYKDKKYTTASPLLRDHVMELALKIGKSVCFWPLKDNRGYKCDMLSLSDYNYPIANKTKKQDKMVNWEGQVYCVEVPNTSLIVRRNGKAVVTGNTLYRYFFERKTPTGIILTYTDDPQSLEVARSRIEAKMAEDPTYIPWLGVSQKTGRGRCVTGDSLIWTIDGLLTAKEIFEKQIYTSVDTIDGIQPIEKHYKFDNKPITKVILYSGVELKSTPDHPHYTQRGWVEAKDLKINEDYVLTAIGHNIFPSLPPKLPEIEYLDCKEKRLSVPTELTTDLAKLIGYYIAEGNMLSIDDRLSGICFAAAHEGIKDNILQLINKITGLTGHYCSNDRVLVTNRAFARWFAKILGWEKNGAGYKKLPSVVLQAPKKQILAFLTGYLTDGWCGQRNTLPKINFCSASNELLREVQQLLFNLGIKNSLYSQKEGYWKTHIRKMITGATEISYRLSTDGLFAAKLASMLLPYVTNKHYDKLEIVSKFVTKETRKRTKFAYQIRDEKGIWLQVKQVTNCENETVYDLTIKNTHSYVVNGLITHNTDFVRLFHTLSEMDYLPVRNEIRERIAMMFGVPPLWQSDTSGMGGLGSQNRQLEMFSRVVESDQRLLNEKVIPLLLADFGITDWKIGVKTPEEKTEEARLSLASQRIQAANVLFTMGFDIELAENKGAKIDDVNFTISGRAKRPEIPMMGMGVGNGMPQPGQPTIPLQEGEGETEPVSPAGQEVEEDVKNLMNKATNKHLPFGTRFDISHGLHNATDKHENNPKDRFNELQKEFRKYSAEVNPDNKRSLSEQEEESSDT